MNKKQIIQIVVIIIAFGLAGFVLYNGFFKGNGGGPLLLDSPAISAQAQPEDLLPEGTTLNFDLLKQQNLFYNQVPYPKLNPVSDFGIPVSSLIIPPPSITGK
jgi:hypothetical protein